MLASWAYADLALVFYSLAALYAFAKFRITQERTWLWSMALMAGFAMSVKYTAFVVPLTCGLLLLLERPVRGALRNAAQFSALAILTALPYYARNALLMGNPFYPFAFGGRYWDGFLSDWFADAGTGIGRSLPQLLLLPVNTLLGYRDANFFDGRMGPLFLVLAPVTLWVLLARARRGTEEGWSLLAIGVFWGLLELDDDESLDDMLQEMIAMGLKGLEVVFPEHSPEQTHRYTGIARRHMLLMTGGTDFHGDTHPEVRMGVGKGDLHVPYSLYEKLIERGMLEAHRRKRRSPVFAPRGRFNNLLAPVPDARTTGAPAAGCPRPRWIRHRHLRLKRS